MDSTKLRYLIDATETPADDRVEWTHQLPRRVRVVEFDMVYGDGPWGSDEPVAGFGWPPLPTSPPKETGRTALMAFLNLADASDREVAAFVRRHGHLGLCDHGLPRTHRPLANETIRRMGALCMHVTEGGTSGAEPLDHLRAWSQLARATVAAAAADEPEQIPSEVALHWATVFGAPMPVLPADRRAAASRLLNRVWLPLGLVRAEVNLNGAPAVQTVAYAGVIGVIALQLIRACLRGDIAYCGVCGIAALAKRRPQRGRRYLCGAEACRRENWRRSKRNTRGRHPVRRARGRIDPAVRT